MQAQGQRVVLHHAEHLSKDQAQVQSVSILQAHNNPERHAGTHLGMRIRARCGEQWGLVPLSQVLGSFLVQIPQPLATPTPPKSRSAVLRDDWPQARPAKSLKASVPSSALATAAASPPLFHAMTSTVSTTDSRQVPCKVPSSSSRAQGSALHLNAFHPLPEILLWCILSIRVAFVKLLSSGMKVEQFREAPA